MFSSAADEKTDTKDKANESLKTEIWKLSNEELLKQAGAIYAKSSGDYLAAARAVAGIEAQLEDTAKQLADLVIPKAELNIKSNVPTDKDSPDKDAARAAVAAAAEFIKQCLFACGVSATRWYEHGQRQPAA